MYFMPIRSSSFCTIVIRHFTSLPKLPKLREIPSKYRSRVVLQAQQALTDYLHITRCLPFSHAEHISKNSLFSLSNLISKLPYSHKTFSKDFSRLLRYHPINEFEFFLESIGIPFPEIEKFLPSNEFFLSENESILRVVGVLLTFGFPWNKLGKLYSEEILIFGIDSKVLHEKLSSFIALGFDASSVIGICLACPFVLIENDDLGTRVDALFGILKRVFLDYSMKGIYEGNVDASYTHSRKIKVFIDLGCEINEVGELMGKSSIAFFECSEEVLVQKLDFFRRLNVDEKEVGMLLLRCPEILQYDLENPKFSVISFLKQFGLSDEEMNDVAVEYAYVLGKNRLANLPNLLRALNLQKWFFNKIIDGKHHLLASVNIGNPDEKLEKDYKNCLERVRALKCHRYAMDKLDFLLTIGFGENLITIKVLSELYASGSQLQERFIYFLDAGFEFNKLCRMIKMHPKILNQSPGAVERKLDFLQNDIGCSLQYLDVFPGYLCFSLENRIIPRYMFYMCLKENGFAMKDYSIASIIASSETRFIAQLLTVHGTAVKQWLERFSSKNHSFSLREA